MKWGALFSIPEDNLYIYIIIFIEVPRSTFKNITLHVSGAPEQSKSGVGVSSACVLLSLDYE